MLIRAIVVATLMLGSTSLLLQKERIVKPRKEYRGYIRDVKLLAPAKEFFVEQEDFARFWKSWRNGKPPKVDFSKELVVTAHCGGPNVPRVTIVLREHGDLVVGTFCTKVGGPGFKYWIGIVPREGVKTIRGKPISK